MDLILNAILLHNEKTLMHLICLALLILELSSLAWFGYAHRFEPLPDFAPRLERLLEEVQPKIDSSGIVPIGQMSDDSVARLEAMRKDQIGDLANARNILPGEETQIEKTQAPANLKESKAMIREILTELETDVQLVWFQAVLPLPLLFRLGLWLPPLTLPWILWNLRPQRKHKDPHVKALIQAIRNQDAPNFLKFAPTLSGEHWLRNAPLKMKIQALRCLIQSRNTEEVLRWGSTFTSLHPENKTLALELASYIALRVRPLPNHLASWMKEWSPKLGKAEREALIREAATTKGTAWQEIA